MEAEQPCQREVLQHQQSAQQKGHQEVLSVSMNDNASQYIYIRFDLYWARFVETT